MTETLPGASDMDFGHAAFGRGGPRVFRLGLSTTYWPGKKAIHFAIDQGVSVFFGFGMDLQMFWVLRDVMRRRRDQFVVATGAYNLIWGHTSIRRTLERRLKALRTDYIDAFLFLGVMKEEQFPARVREDLVRLREEGKVRRIGVSTHDRKLAGRLAAEGVFDALMIRYNAAHPGAEDDVFPHLATHDPALISYTATRWSFLLRRPRGYPKGERLPTAAECYRFALSNPHVDVCLTAPYNLRQLRENLSAVDAGPLSAEDMAFMRAFGERVRHTKKWFM
jgi:aryl-alcohol dehydrogenase-like predicted oxidoreductase